MNHLGKFLFGTLLSLSCVLPAQAADSLMMATTTSTQDSGLLEYVAPVFKKETGIDLKWVAVGTGKALEISKNCDADVLLVHAPDVEKKFIDDGYGIDRRQVMYNDFVIVGPKADPAKIAGKTTGEALKAIYDAKAGFVSRGDKSGTHSAELKLWKQFNLNPDKEPFYISAGQGMMATLAIAAEKGAVRPHRPRHLDQVRKPAGQEQSSRHRGAGRQRAVQSVQRHHHEPQALPQRQEGSGREV